jgi:hypothetical protein
MKNYILVTGLNLIAQPHETFRRAHFLCAHVHNNAIERLMVAAFTMAKVFEMIHTVATIRINCAKKQPFDLGGFNVAQVNSVKIVLDEAVLWTPATD